MGKQTFVCTMAYYAYYMARYATNESEVFANLISRPLDFYICNYS